MVEWIGLDWIGRWDEGRRKDLVQKMARERQDSSALIGRKKDP